MGYFVIAPVGDDIKPLFVGMKEFPTERVFLISQKRHLRTAHKMAKKLDDFTIKSKIIEIGDSLLPEMFRAFANICSHNDNDNLIVNVSTGDKMGTCASLSAAYANGLKAFSIVNNRVVFLPIMKLSYFNELSETKLRILKALDHKKEVALSDLSKRLKLSSALLSYHIHGTPRYKGLEEFRLVVLNEKNNRVFVRLSDIGFLLISGY